MPKESESVPGDLRTQSIVDSFVQANPDSLGFRRLGERMSTTIEIQRERPTEGAQTDDKERHVQKRRKGNERE